MIMVILVLLFFHTPILASAKTSSDSSLELVKYYGSYLQQKDNPFFTKIAWPYPESGNVLAVQGSVKLGEDTWNHGGWDIKGEEHKPVYAMAEGEVVYTGMLKGVYAVVIQHKTASLDGYLTSFYLNLCSTHNSVAVRKGDRVKAGSLLGVLGKPGRDGKIEEFPHLHLELRWSEDADTVIPSSKYTVDLFATGLHALRPADGRESASALRTAYRDFTATNGKKIPAVFQFDARLFLYSEKEIFGIQWEDIEPLLALDVVMGYESWSYLLNREEYSIWFPYREIQDSEISNGQSVTSLNQSWNDLMKLNQHFEAELPGFVPTDFIEWEFEESSEEEENKGDFEEEDADQTSLEGRMILVGDSRVALMENAVKESVETEFVSKSKQGYVWLQYAGVQEVDRIRKPGDKIVIWIGTNDYLINATFYQSLFQTLSKDRWKEHEIYIVEVGFVNKDLVNHYYGYQQRDNKTITQYNTQLKSILGKNMTWIPINHLIDVEDTKIFGSRKDGLHYSNQVSQKIYDEIVRVIFQK